VTIWSDELREAFRELAFTAAWSALGIVAGLFILCRIVPSLILLWKDR
jgi:hypothetical protein